MAANDLIYAYGSEFVLDSGGTAPLVGVTSVQSASSVFATAQHGDYPEADFTLTCSFAGMPSAGGYIGLYRQGMAVTGTSNAKDVSKTYLQVLVGVFPLASDTSIAATYFCPDVPVGKSCKYWLENASGQNLNPAWRLTVTPKTFKPAT
jgi:hypothetical protein